MAFTKITNADLNSRGATTLPNQPTISASALKQEFDAPAKNVVAPKFNNLIDELEAVTASASLGAQAPTGRTGNTVQAVLNSISTEVDGKSTISLSNVSTSGVRIATVSINGAPVDLKAPEGGGGTWGTIEGNIADQTDLSNALNAKANSADLATVATSGDYGDLDNKPTIPTKTSDLTNDSNFATTSDVSTAVATKSKVTWNQQVTTGQKIATVSIDGTPTDVYAPTGGGGGGGNVDSVNGQQGVVVLGVADIDDVSISGLADNDALVYDSGDWVNKPLADVATSGSYNDLSNKPTIPAAQVNSDWNAASGVAQILNKPTIPAAQIQSDWNQADSTAKDFIKNKPTIPTVNNSTITIQKNSTTVDSFTTNASSAKNINIPMDEWTSAYTTLDGTTAVFSGLNDNYGYDLYCDGKLVGISNIAKTGSGTSVTLTYTVTGASIGDVFKLRILK